MMYTPTLVINYLRKLSARSSRDLLVLSLGILTLTCGNASHAQPSDLAAAAAFPNRPIQIVVPYPPGGGGDVFARLLGKKLTEVWKQPVIVVSKPGASGMIGADAVAKAKPDGYTLLAGYTAEMAVNPSFYPKVTYDPERDFAPIALLVTLPMVLVVNSSSPVESLTDFIAFARNRPNELSFASSGAGSPTHLAHAMLVQATGLRMVHVPYKGAGDIVPAIVGGHVFSSFIGLPAATPHLRSGKLRALGLSTLERATVAPSIVPIAEAGVPGFDFPTWFGLFAPAGTPHSVVAKLNSETIKALNAPDAKTILGALGAQPGTMNTEHFAGFIKEEIHKYADLIKRSNVRPE